jgi:hypothetical protein
VDTCCVVPVCVSFAASAVFQEGPAAPSRTPPNGPPGTMIGG